VRGELRIYPDLQALSAAAAAEILKGCENALGERGVFTLVLSGGYTPRALYQLLATEYGDRLSWRRVHLFFGDERYVPVSSPESNYRMAYDTFISRIPIPEGNVHPIPTDGGDPAADAESYEDEIKVFLAVRELEGFDLVLLGLGEDGHTASLYPGDPVLDEKERWIAAVTAPPGHGTRRRITMTLPAINSARQALFLLSGAGKRKAVKELIETTASDAKACPAALVQPRERVLWLVDKEAALR